MNVAQRFCQACKTMTADGHRCTACGFERGCADVKRADEEFAQFVFAHFGGYWTRTDPLQKHMAALPKRIADRVSELAREFELKRGGP